MLLRKMRKTTNVRKLIATSMSAKSQWSGTAIGLKMREHIIRLSIQTVIQIWCLPRFILLCNTLDSLYNVRSCSVIHDYADCEWMLTNYLATASINTKLKLPQYAYL